MVLAACLNNCYNWGCLKDAQGLDLDKETSEDNCVELLAKRPVHQLNRENERENYSFLLTFFNQGNSIVIFFNGDVT